MLESELVRGSPTRTEGDRGLAGGLQHGTPTQLAEVSDAGRVRCACRRATGVSPTLVVFITPAREGSTRKNPEMLTYDWTKNGGRSFPLPAECWIRYLLPTPCFSAAFKSFRTTSS